MDYVLGLDLGSNSVGWAMISKENQTIIDCGVRIFSEGVNKIDSENEVSKNAERRNARQKRVQLFRKRRRKFLLKLALQNLGLMPNQLTPDYFRNNPYEFRADALHQKIDKYELGRVFYHLAQRRGYKSNRKIADKETSKVVEPAIKEQKKNISNADATTIGEYLNSLNPHEDRYRSRYLSREMYEKEFDLIWKKQSEYYEFLDENAYNNIKGIVFFQKPLQSQKGRVGRCIFEKNKRRSPRSSPLAQEFRMLSQVNSLRITGGSRIHDEQMELSDNEREALIAYLSEHKDISLKPPLATFKKTLNLDKKIEYAVNLESQGKLDGLKTICDIRKAFGKKFNALSEEEIHHIWHLLYSADDKDWLKEYAANKWGLTQEEANTLSSISLEPSYFNSSSKALNKILPYLRAGMIYSDACREAGYHHSDTENVTLTDKLPEPPKIANPIVRITLFELKKIVNAIIDRYGIPSRVQIELARQLKIPRAKRLQLLKENRAREKDYDRIRAELKKELNIDNPSRNDLIKYRLWEECNRICPYTGKSISLQQLYITGEVDIEHIWPHSRTLDNTYTNLSLCFRNENIFKSDKTPYEAYSGQSEKYEEIKHRIKILPHNKARRFLTKKIEGLDNFVERQIRDTAYISREAVKYMRHICDNVYSVSGTVTYLLRKFWGLNSLLHYEENKGVEPDKRRDDHRHHAIDAIVVALSNLDYVRRFSTYHKFNDSYESLKKYKDKFPAPWGGFRSDVGFAISNIIVSHKVKYKVSGALHEETHYRQLKSHSGNVLLSDNNKPLYAVRKNLEKLTHNEIRQIIDPAVKQAVHERLLSLGVDIYQKIFTIPKEAWKEPLYHPSIKPDTKVLIKKVRISKPSNNMKNIRGYNLWVEPGANHHILLFKDRKGKIKGEVKTVFDAFIQKVNGESPYKHNLAEGDEFLMTLQINELYLDGEFPDNFDFDDKSTYHRIFDNIYRVQKTTQAGQITFRNHKEAKLEARKDNNKEYEPGVLRKNPSKIKGYKLKIDPIGYLELAL